MSAPDAPDAPDAPTAPPPAPAGRSVSRLLSVAAVMTLVGLALMAWSMLQPTWIPVMLAMTLGQLVGSSAFAVFLYVIVRDLRRELRRDAAPAAREAAP